MRRGGITGDAAVATFSGLIALNYGWSAFVTARGTVPTDHERTRRLGESLTALPPDQYPLTVEVAESMGHFGTDEHYEIALQQVLAGARAAAPH